MSQSSNFKSPSFSYKTSHRKLFVNFLSGALGVGIGLVIGSYLGWL